MKLFLIQSFSWIRKIPTKFGNRENKFPRNLRESMICEIKFLRKKMNLTIWPKSISQNFQYMISRTWNRYFKVRNFRGRKLARFCGFFVLFAKVFPAKFLQNGLNRESFFKKMFFVTPLILSLEVTKILEERTARK